MNQELRVSAPGRICLYGEHQDYLELAVIPAAIDMRTTVTGHARDDDKIHVNALDLNQEVDWELQTGGLALTGDALDYMRAVVNVFLKKGHHLRGMSVDVQSEIPLKSGLSSSAALLVAWAKFIAELHDIKLTAEELGNYAYLAEHDEMGIPCGQMDQLASAVGRLFYMECVEPPVISKIDNIIPGLVIGDTLIPKSTSSVHGTRVNEITRALALLKEKIDFDLKTVKWEALQPYMSTLPENLQKRVRATVRDRDITTEAFLELRKSSPDLEYLGSLLDRHQRFLRDDYEVSVPKIDHLLDAAREAGALGGKLTGAGMGGFVITLAPGCQEEVARAITRAGGKGYVVEIDEGARVD